MAKPIREDSKKNEVVTKIEHITPQKNIGGFDWKDKLLISGTKFCPPHRIPHKFPLGKKIDYEHCHIHTRRRGMLHHMPFCKIMKCKHYSSMVDEYKRYRRLISVNNTEG
jgi:hypothetical protein